MPDTTLLRTFCDNAEQFGHLGVASCLLCRRMRLVERGHRVSCSIDGSNGWATESINSEVVAMFRSNAAKCVNYESMQP